MWHSIEQVGCFGDPPLGAEALDKVVENNNKVPLAATSEHDSEDGAGAAVDEEAAGEAIWRDPTGPIHLGKER